MKAGHTGAHTAPITNAATSQGRLMSIDILRCVAAFLVIVIHFASHEEVVSFKNWVSHLYIVEARIAVPLFFMITGYFYPMIMSHCKLPHQLRKLLIMAIGSTLFYIACELAGAYIAGSFDAHVKQIFSLKTLSDLLIFNITPGSGHLWFFYAMLYALVIIAFFDKIKQRKLLNIIAIISFLTLLASNFTSLYLYTRNFLFFGIPFILLGRSFAEGRLKALVPKVTKSMCLTTMLSCMILIGFEMDMYGTLFPSLLPQRECFIFSVPEAIAIFALTLKFKANPTNKFQRTAAHIGKKYSAYIYIFQYFAGAMGGDVYNYFFSGVWMKMLLGVPTIFILSLIISIIYLKLKTKLLKSLHPNKSE
jgi:surface polysaccharide O-acyltransferase-like enzyme